MPPPTLTPDQFLSSFPPLTQTLAHRLRRLVHRALPTSTEQVRLGWQLIGFYVPGRARPVYTGFIIPHPTYVTLGFEYGLLLNDPAHLLLGGAEKLKQVRYLTFHHAKDIHPAALLSFLQQAAALALMPTPLRRQLLLAARQRLQ